MLKLTSVKQMRQIEETANEQGMSFLRLMENAGSAAYATLKKYYSLSGRKTAVLCGNGNNGGDGFVVARKLLGSGYPVTVILTSGEPKTTDSAHNLNRLEKTDVAVVDYLKDKPLALKTIDECDLVVDAVFGTGFHGDPSPEIAELFSKVNKSGKKVVSLDIPSGVCTDSGTLSNSFLKADLTVSFSALKLAHIMPPAKEVCGEIVVADIGIENEILDSVEKPILEIDETVAKSLLKERDDLGNKSTFGRLINVSGSENFSGAAILSTKAALRSGVGLVSLATEQGIMNSLRSVLIENTFLNQTASEVLSQKSNAILLGCGLSQTEEKKKLVKEILNGANVPVILDADGINCIKSDITILKGHKKQIIITAHVGEFARLLGKEIDEIKTDRLNLGEQFASEYNLTLVLKDYVTFVFTPDSTHYYLNPNSGLAKGGSGDVLAGIVASLSAQGYSEKESAILGVYLQGEAGNLAKNRLGAHFMQPSDVIDELSFVFKKISK